MVKEQRLAVIDHWPALICSAGCPQLPQAMSELEITDVYLEPCQTSKAECLTKKVNWLFSQNNPS